MGHLFVSYSRRDKKIVKKLVDSLERDGHEVWLDTEDIQGGDQWRQAIVGAIKQGYALIVAISSNSVASNNVRKELDVAEKARVRIIPVRLTAAEIPDALQYQLAGVQEIDVSGNFKDGIGRLKRVLGDDTKVVQAASKRRKKRHLVWVVGGAIVGVLAALWAGSGDPVALGMGAGLGALLGFAGGFVLKVIGWISRLVVWGAAFVAGVVAGGSATESFGLGDPQIGAIAGGVVGLICLFLLKRWRKKHKLAKLAALAAKA